MPFKSLLFLLFLLVSPLAFSQKEANNWFFGCGYGTTFNSGQPSPITSNPANCSRHGSSSMSDASGKLLFFVTYNQVSNSKKNKMPHGALKFSTMTVQPSIIVPWPDSSHLYYIFTPGGNTNDWFKYSVVNMKMDGGLGDVDSNRRELPLPTLCAGKVTAVRHANRSDYWVLTPIGNTDTVCAYLITSKGIQLPPVKSHTGVFANAGSALFGDDYAGIFKVSPNGKKVCNINRTKPSLIADFDNVTGKISNVWTFTKGYGPGMEFSPKGDFLYTYKDHNALVQLDLKAKNVTALLASQKTIDSSNYFGYRFLQMAPDGKMYVYVYNNNYLEVILAPDSVGKKCRYQKNYFKYMNFPESTGHTGLPTFVQSFFYKPSFDIFQNCLRDTLTFKVRETYELDSARWDFGDPGSGTNNVSTQTGTVFHVYKSPGTYTIKLISYYKKYSDTIFQNTFINYAKPNLGKDTLICTNNYISLSTIGTFKTYKWSTGQSLKSIFVTKPGKYRLTVTEDDGCMSSDTIEVKNLTIKANFSISDTGLCLLNNRFNFKETTQFGGLSNKIARWYFEDGSSVNDSVAQKTFNHVGVYKVKMISESINHCIDSVTKIVNVWPHPVSSFTINNLNQCLIGNSYNFVNTSSIPSGILNFEWDLGDLKGFQTDYLNKPYAKAANYAIKLIAISENNCRDTSSKSIEIYENPKADFSWVTSCEFSATPFTFTGSKPQAHVNTTLTWDFNKESISNLETPTFKFSGAGVKKVSLLVQSDNGCIDSISKDVEVKPQSKADFEVSDICESDSANFTNRSLGGVNYFWKFGDGLNSNLLSPKHKYTIAGTTTTFNVTLVANVPKGCSDSITRAVTVNANPTAGFTYVTSGKLVYFTATDLNANLYKWNFGDGSTDSSKTPKINYSYSKFPSAKYTACLTTRNLVGCSTNFCKEILISGAINPLRAENALIYPNPNSGVFQIEFKDIAGNYNVELFNSLGQIINNQYFDTCPQTVQYEHLSKGIYLLRLSSGGQSLVQRVVVR
jgi:hypothetical protein